METTHKEESTNTNKNLVTCKACGQGISKNAEVCPHCGEPIPKKKKTSIWTWLVLVVFVLYIIGQLGERKSNSSNSIIAETVAPMNVAIGVLLSDYKNNEVGADNKYKNKVVKVTGIVDDIGKDILDDMYVTLGTGKQFEIPQVQAFFDDSNSNVLGSLNKGDRITVVCKIRGKMMNVLAKECSIK